jgi:streptogramin lyase
MTRATQWVGLAAAMVMFVAACSSGASSPNLAPTTPAGSAPTAAATAADELAALTDLQVTLDGAPDFPIVDFGSLWVVRPDADEPSVTRLDPATGAIQAEIPIGDGLCEAIGVSDDAIWACSETGVARIDPATNVVTGDVEADIGQYYGRLPFGDGSIWAVGGEGVSADALLRIDPEAMKVADSVPLGFNAGGLAFDFGALWITDPVGGRLVRYDPASGELTDHVTALTAPRYVETGFDSVWVGLYDSRDVDRPAPGEPTLARVDPAGPDAVQAWVAVGPDPLEACPYAGTAGLWVRSGNPYLALVDPTTNTVVKTVASKNPPGCVVEVDGRLWVISYELQKLWRLKPGAP